MGQDYAEEICQAIDQIVTKRIEAISFDKTFTVTIADDAEASYGKYKVSDGTAEYYAYSTDTSYRTGERVYITVPNGDFTQQKIIVGKYVSTDNGVNYNYIRPFSTFVDISGNLLEGNSDNYKCDLLANYPVDLNTGEKVIPDRVVNGNTVTYDYLDEKHYYHGVKIWEADLRHLPLTDYTRLGMKAQFKSYLSQLNCINGNYGLRLVTKFLHSASASEANLYYQAKEKIDSLLIDMPEALFNIYCEYHGLITHNQVTQINTKSEYKAYTNKLNSIYDKHYTWLMSHSEDLELNSVDNLTTWNKWNSNEDFREELNTLQTNYFNKLKGQLSSQNQSLFDDENHYFYNSILIPQRNAGSLVILFLELLEKRQLIFEKYYSLIQSVDASENYYENMTTAQYQENMQTNYILTVVKELKDVVNEFNILIENKIFKSLREDLSKKEGQSETAYTMDLDVTQMIGDPYGLESYTEQEAVFPINGYGQLIKAELYFFQRIGKLTDDDDNIIANLSFYDKQNNEIPYTDPDNPTLPNVLNNLFEKDPYICVGYSLEDFDKEHVQLYTFDPLTYSANSGMDSKLNKKIIYLRWLHKQDDDSTLVVDKDTTFESADGVKHYPDIRWYRYRLGAPSPDEYAGISWERINETEMITEERTEEVTTTESMPEIASLKTFYLVFHQIPGSSSPTSSASESTYVANFQPEYSIPKTINDGFPLRSANNASYTGFWTTECREKYHLSEELASHAFVGQQTSHMEIYGQTWEDIFLSKFVYHNNHYTITDFYTNRRLNSSDVHNGYSGYGCLHTIGFWEKLTMAYRLYHAYPNEFKALGVDDLFLTGGSVEGTDWDYFKNKNLYTDISYQGNYVYPSTDYTKFTFNTAQRNPLRQLFMLFTNSFGEWDYFEDEYGMKDYRPVDEEVYQRLYDACLYLFQKIDDPTYTHTEIVTHTVIKTPDFFRYVLVPDLDRQEERIKVIIKCIDDIYESNELVFTNESYVANPVSSDQAQGFYLWCADKTYGNYFIYSMNNLLINEKHANVVRNLEAHFQDYTQDEGSSDLLSRAEKITWKIPYRDTMLIPYGIDLENGRAKEGFYADADVDVNEDGYVYITKYGRSDEDFKIDPILQYTIARSYTQTCRNNFIQCVITINNNTYSAVKEFTFGTMGTSGTDYTLIIDLDDNVLALDADSRKPTLLNATARLYDSEGIDVTDKALAQGEWEWFWHPDTCGIDFDMGKILLDSGFKRSVRLAADFYDLDALTGNYYTKVNEVNDTNYTDYYYQKTVPVYKYVSTLIALSNYVPVEVYYTYNNSTEQYEIVNNVTNSNYTNYYVKVEDGTTYEYHPATELTKYDNTISYWKQNAMYESTNRINKDNYGNYCVEKESYIQQTNNSEYNIHNVYYIKDNVTNVYTKVPGLTKDTFNQNKTKYYLKNTWYENATINDINNNVASYYEIVPASKATKTTYQKYYINNNGIYVHNDSYTTKTSNGNDLIYYEFVEAVGITGDNFRNYYFQNTNYFYELVTDQSFTPGTKYYQITRGQNVNSSNYKLYYLKRNDNEYYHPTDEITFSTSSIYYQIRETTAINSSTYNVNNNYYTRKVLDQFEHPTVNDRYSKIIRYYEPVPASAVTFSNYKARVDSRAGVYYKTNNQYRKVILDEQPNFNANMQYYFLFAASEVNEENYTDYYIQKNGNYVNPTEYNKNDIYYKLTAEVNQLISSKQAGTNTASISCVGDISLNNFLILGVTLKNWGNYQLTTFLPIPIREVDEFKYTNLTINPEEVKQKLEDYTYQGQTYDELIASYQRQVGGLPATLNDTNEEQLNQWQKELNDEIQTVMNSQNTELFVQNTYSTFAEAAKQFAVSRQTVVTTTVPNDEATINSGNYVYTSKKFCEILQRLADEEPTVYNNTSGMNLGIWTPTNVQPHYGYYSFDCWNLVKSIIWGFNFSKYGALGGGVYQSNGLPDTDGWGICSMSYDLSTSFSAEALANMKPGEFLYKNGHAGVFIGSRPNHTGYWAIECTPAGTGNVQWSTVEVGGVRNLGGPWTHHCKLPWINYSIPPTKTVTTIIDESTSGYEEALEKLNEYAKIIGNTNSTIEEINDALKAIDNLVSVKGDSKRYIDTNTLVVGEEQATASDKYYNELFKIRNEFDKQYFKYFKELQDTENMIVNTSQDSNAWAVAMAHLYGGFAVDVDHIQFEADVNTKKYQEQFINKYFATETLLNDYFNDLRTVLIDEMSDIAAHLLASGIHSVEGYTISGIASTAYESQIEIDEAKIQYLDYADQLKSLNLVHNANSSMFKEFTNIYKLFLKAILSLIDIDTEKDMYCIYANTISPDTDLAEYNSSLVSCYRSYRKIIENRLSTTKELKDVYKKLNIAYEDQYRYLQQKKALENLRLGVNASWQAKELTQDLYTTQINSLNKDIKSLEQKLVNVEKDIQKSIKQIATLTSGAGQLTIMNDEQYKELIQNKINELTNQRSEITNIINESSTLLDVYDENNNLTFKRRQYGYIVGPTTIIYPASGESYNINTNHNEPYLMYMFPHVEETEGYWKIYNPHNEDPSYIGKFSECSSEGGLGYFSGLPYSNMLEPAAVYSATAHQYGVQYVEVNVKNYAIPLFNEDSGKWEIYILPGWNDGVNDDGTKKLGLRSLLIKYYDTTKPVSEQSQNVQMIRRAVINNSRTVWTQPIYTYQNLYPSGTVNTWNGRQVEMGDNYVLAAFMAAGKKNADNTFSGVMFGDYSQDPKGAEWSLAGQTGVYGFKGGAMSYAFKEDGTAFIGPAGKGRIQFDGNKGIIASSGYIGTVGLKPDNFTNGFSENFLINPLSEGQCGMMIDLDDSIIDMRGTVEYAKVDKDDFYVRAYQATGAQVLIEARDPYLKITTANDGITTGNTIMNVGVKNYYLQSDNFGKFTSNGKKYYQGSRIDLATGDIILAGNITWSGRWEDQQVQMLFSSGYANASYILDTSLVKGEPIIIANDIQQKSYNDGKHYTRNGNTYTLFTEASGAYYSEEEEYYILNENNIQYTIPPKPCSDNIAWTNRCSANGTKYTITSTRRKNPNDGTTEYTITEDTWPDNGVLKSQYKNMRNMGNTYYPVWHKVQATESNGTYVKDNYVSYSYDQGKTWSDPEKIDGHLTDVNLMASLLNSVNADGIYNNGGSIGIRAAAIRTGILYSREGKLDASDNIWDRIRKKVNTAIDVDGGRIDLHDTRKIGNTVKRNLNFLRLGAGFDIGATTDQQLWMDGLRMGNGAIWIKGNGDIVWGQDETMDPAQAFDNQRIQVLYSTGIVDYVYEAIPDTQLSSWKNKKVWYINTSNNQLTQITLTDNNYNQKTTYYKRYDGTQDVGTRYKYSKPTKPIPANAYTDFGKVTSSVDGRNYWAQSTTSGSYRQQVSGLKNVGGANPIWHIEFNSNDHFCSWSYDQGKTWTEPQAIDGQISDTQMMAALLNNIHVDGLFNDGHGNIGIRAAAIRTGLLYSREAALLPSDDTFAEIALKAGCVIDLDNGQFALQGSNNSLYLTPGGTNTAFPGKSLTINMGKWNDAGEIKDWIVNKNWAIFSGNANGGKFGVTTGGVLYAQGGSFAGDVYVDDLYIKDSELRYNKVVPTEVTIPVAFTVDEVWADIYTKHTNAGSETVTLHEMLELGDYTTVYWFDPPNGILSTQSDIVLSSYDVPSAGTYTVVNEWDSYWAIDTGSAKVIDGKIYYLRGDLHYSPSTYTITIPYSISVNIADITGATSYGALDGSDVTKTITWDTYTYEPTLLGYNAYISKVVKGTVYTDGDYL